MPEGKDVEVGLDLVVWDPFTSAILTEIGGTVEFQDIVEGENVREETDRVTGLSQRIGRGLGGREAGAGDGHPR